MGAMILKFNAFCAGEVFDGGTPPVRPEETMGNGYHHTTRRVESWDRRMESDPWRENTYQIERQEERMHG